MELSAKEAWKRLLDEARRELPDATVRTWLEPAEPIALDDGRLIVGAPDQFAVEWNESKHAGVLARAAERVLGQPTAVVFRVQEERQQRPQMDFFVAPREPVAAARTAVKPRRRRSTSATRSRRSSSVNRTSWPRRRPTRSREAPGKTYNPLFIYGATGLGKTHLMQAIAHAVLAEQIRAPGCSTSAPSSSSTKSSNRFTPARCRSSGAATATTWTSSWWTTCISSKARK